jgi:hypothetical protein
LEVGEVEHFASDARFERNTWLVHDFIASYPHVWLH